LTNLSGRFTLVIFYWQAVRKTLNNSLDAPATINNYNPST